MIKIACIGDSLTYGYLVEDREINCYPVVLNELLGEDYAVGNFGVNGHTMLKSGDKPFWTHENFKLSTLFEPDIVIIMLGSNDSKPHNFTTIDQYVADYEEMINHYRSLTSKPRIYIATPPTVFTPIKPTTLTIRREQVNLMADSIRKLGKKLRISVIDINKVTANYAEGFVADGVHTNQLGAKLIANVMYRELSKK
jgi:lysophospholipase L1-like esterase